MALGIAVGALPGLSVTLAVALMLPFTFAMDPGTGVLFLVAIYCGGIYAGSITAILLKTPGSPASAATTADGYALAQQGKASQALSVSLYASVAGGLFSGFTLLLFSPLIAELALMFGPPEFLTLALFGMTVIASVSGDSISKGMVMAILGMLIATVGVDPMTGSERFIFGAEFLLGGIEIVPVLIGLFAISEVLLQVEKKSKRISVRSGSENQRKVKIRELKPYRRTIFRSSVIGSIVGSIPGLGAEISSFISYGQAKKKSKEPKKFGKGSMEGVAASEAGNNGVTGATLIPTMTLGIPGSVVAAVLLGAFLVQGLNPGPQLFQESGDVAYTVILGFIVANIVMLIEGKLAIRWFAKVATIPSSILFPIVLSLCLMGGYAFENQIYTVGITIFFGVLGYLLSKLQYPLAPMLIALILGPIAEEGLRQSLMLSGGSLAIFFVRPISLFLIILILLSVIMPFVAKYRKNKTANRSL
ncbi:tripartite tricarboxylate transporter permease [Salicibibacter cibi]|uniref:Tripartite tricarboxylate transporter permease n=2 Tax=Salicibibacter cibi TaxID=2743001 RepID=A0A7T6ZED7_9BACI|nr:tripartite tricarboxylate transporter permease [Salicibibacter cibi]